MWSSGFDKNSGPGTGAPTQQTPSFGYRPPSQSPSSWFDGSYLKPEGHQSPAVPPIIPSHNPGTAKTQVQDLKRTRSPPSLSTYKDVLQNSTTAAGSHPVAQIKKSPHSHQKAFPGQRFGPSSETTRPFVSPPRSNTRPSSHVWTPPYADLDKPATNSSELPVPKRTRSPFSTDLGLRGNNSVHDDDAKRPTISPPRLSTRSSSHVWTPPYTDLDKPATNPSELPVSKRTRLPFSTDLGLRGNNSLHDDAERYDFMTRGGGHTGLNS